MTALRLIDVLDLPPTLSVPEAAALLGVAKNTLYEALADGSAPVAALRVGPRNLRIRTAELLSAIGVDPETLARLRAALALDVNGAGPPGPAAAITAITTTRTAPQPGRRTSRGHGATRP
jgi:excisionase family DNA binding protein